MQVKVITDLDEVSKGLIDKDEGNQDGEDLLSETADESDEEAALNSYDDENDDHKPHANPDSPHDVFYSISLAELKGKNKN